MLEFIVLGQVPGTHIQVTFTWFLFAALAGLMYFNHRMKKLPKDTKTAKTKLVASR